MAIAKLNVETKKGIKDMLQKHIFNLPSYSSGSNTYGMSAKSA